MSWNLTGCGMIRTRKDGNVYCDSCKPRHIIGNAVRAPRGKYRNYAYNFKDKDTLQAFNRDGTVNKEFVQAHGTQSLEKEHGVSKEAIMKEISRYG